MPITAALLYDYVNCPHRATLELFGDPALRDPVSPFVQMLWERGVQFEQEVLAGHGLPVTDLSHLTGDTKLNATLDAMRAGEPYIYGGGIAADDLLGQPDLLRREGNGYVAIDIKSGRGLEGGSDTQDGKPKPHYAVQLGLYQDILERLGFAAGRTAYIWDVDGAEIAYDFDAFTDNHQTRRLWQTYEATLAAVEAIAKQQQATQPAYASPCKLCVWYSHCKGILKQQDDLTLIPNLGRSRRDALQHAIPTVQALATTDINRFVKAGKTQFPGIGVKSLVDYQRRAQLLNTAGALAYATQPLSFPQLERELFFDIETDPLRGVCYLHGFLERCNGQNRTERFISFFAETPDDAGEEQAFREAWHFIQASQPCAIYFYSKYERTIYRQLQARYPHVCDRDSLDALFDSRYTVDLKSDGVDRGTYWPTHDHSIKSLARYLGFQWRDTDPSGAASIEWYDQWISTGDPTIKERILAYNEDDCRATRVLLDGLLALPLHQ